MISNRVMQVESADNKSLTVIFVDKGIMRLIGAANTKRIQMKSLKSDRQI